MDCSRPTLYQDQNGIILDFGFNYPAPLPLGDPWIRGVKALSAPIESSVDANQIEAIFNQLEEDNKNASNINPQELQEELKKRVHVPKKFYGLKSQFLAFLKEEKTTHPESKSLYEQYDAYLFNKYRTSLDDVPISRYENFGKIIEELELAKHSEAVTRDLFFRGLVKAYLKFFEAFSIDPADAFQKRRQEEPEKIGVFAKQHFAKLEVVEQAQFLQIYAKTFLIIKKDLEISDWKPTDPITVLIRELNKRGPLCTGSNFGRLCYPTDPIPLKRPIVDRTILHWKKTETQQRTYHAKLVIGATIEGGQQRVYYLDPHIGNDQIYVTSYSKFCDHTLDLDGIRRKTSPKGKWFAVSGKT